MNIVMGIDASTKCTGYSIFKGKELITYGKIPVREDIEDWRHRILFMFDELEKLIDEYNVDTMVVETPVKCGGKSMVTMQILFTLNGVLLELAHLKNISFVPIEVNGWRKALGLSKDIPKSIKDQRPILKERSIKLANKLYNLDLVWKSPTSKFNDDDISDAILIAHSVISLP